MFLNILESFRRLVRLPLKRSFIYHTGQKKSTEKLMAVVDFFRKPPTRTLKSI